MVSGGSLLLALGLGYFLARDRQQPLDWWISPAAPEEEDSFSSRPAAASAVEVTCRCECGEPSARPSPERAPKESLAAIPVWIWSTLSLLGVLLAFLVGIVATWCCQRPKASAQRLALRDAQLLYANQR